MNWIKPEDTLPDPNDMVVGYWRKKKYKDPFELGWILSSSYSPVLEKSCIRWLSASEPLVTTNLPTHWLKLHIPIEE